MACDLEAARITSLTSDAFYISDFVSEDEETWLLQKVSKICDTLALIGGMGICVYSSCLLLYRPDVPDTLISLTLTA